jgi:hypothetical protein
LAHQRPSTAADHGGHATEAFTIDVYTEVADELADAVAAALAAYIPRSSDQQ